MQRTIAAINSDSAIIRPLPRPNARLRLFCFPYAGGSASAYRAWAGLLPEEIDVCAVQLPGRENRGAEPLLTRMTAVADMVTQALPPYLDLPYAFFGHSMGSHIAFETARALRDQRRPGPVHFFASGRHAPQLPDEDEPIHALPPDEFVEALRRLQGTPEEVLEHAELMKMLTPILRADFEICETYQYLPGAPLACPISAYGGETDLEAKPEQLQAWSAQTSRKFEYAQFPGNHFFLHSERDRVLKSILGTLAPFIAMQLEGCYA